MKRKRHQTGLRVDVADLSHWPKMSKGTRILGVSVRKQEKSLFTRMATAHSIAEAEKAESKNPIKEALKRGLRRR